MQTANKVFKAEDSTPGLRLRCMEKLGNAEMLTLHQRQLPSAALSRPISRSPSGIFCLVTSDICNIIDIHCYPLIHSTFIKVLTSFFSICLSQGCFLQVYQRATSHVIVSISIRPSHIRNSFLWTQIWFYLIDNSLGCGEQINKKREAVPSRPSWSPSEMCAGLRICTVRTVIFKSSSFLIGSRVLTARYVVMQAVQVCFWFST